MTEKPLYTSMTESNRKEVCHCGRVVIPKYSPTVPSRYAVRYVRSLLVNLWKIFSYSYVVCTMVSIIKSRIYVLKFISNRCGSIRILCIVSLNTTFSLSAVQSNCFRRADLLLSNYGHSGLQKHVDKFNLSLRVALTAAAGVNIHVCCGGTRGAASVGGCSLAPAGCAGGAPSACRR